MVPIVPHANRLSSVRLQIVRGVLTETRAVLDGIRVPCYVVGGLLRDAQLGRTLGSVRHFLATPHGGAPGSVSRAPDWINIDLAVPRDALKAARQLAESLGGAFVPLDEATDTARVVVERGGARCELDVSAFRGASIEDDLRRRDFTMNAMAMALGDWLDDPRNPKRAIDPLRGRQAIERRVLSACFDQTFDEDPLRVLRGFRFIVQLGVEAAPDLERLMVRGVPGLARVSGERIRDELIAICMTDRAHEALRGLERVGALDVIVPELVPGRGLDQGPFHHLDVLSHQLEAVEQADRFLADYAEFSPALQAPLLAYCGEELVERRPRKALIKLAALLHDVGKPSSRQVHPDGEIWFIGHEQTGLALAQQVVERLRLSNREAHMVCQLVLHHLRPGFLSREPQLTRRALYRFYKDLADDGPACALEWWADRMATRGTKSRVDQIDQQRVFLEELLMAYFFKAEEVVKPPKLVDGHALMQAFSLPPGPGVGVLLEAIEEAQAEGRVRSRDEAMALAKTLLQVPPAPKP